MTVTPASPPFLPHRGPPFPVLPGPDVSRPDLPDSARNEALRVAARDLESAFLAEMLTAAGLGRPVAGFGGGGIGEDQFASFVVRAQADAIAARGGLGLADHLFHTLQRRDTQ